MLALFARFYLNIIRESADGVFNSANLEVKGIIAIKAMSDISTIAIQPRDAISYSVRRSFLIKIKLRQLTS